MHRLTVIALTLLVVFASFLPTVLARETNADRLRRGYPPLHPSRREVAKRQQPSSTPPNTASEILEVRDSSGAHRLGFVGSFEFYRPGPVTVTTDKNGALSVTFSSATKRVEVFNVNSFPSFLRGISESTGSPQKTLEIDGDNPNDGIWAVSATTNELTANLPGLAGIVWDEVNNELKLVDSTEAAPGTTLVRLYLAS